MNPETEVESCEERPGRLLSGFKLKSVHTTIERRAYTHTHTHVSLDEQKVGTEETKMVKSCIEIYLNL